MTFAIINEVGDLDFQAPRRQWIQTANEAGVKTFGYLFTQPQPDNAPEDGGEQVRLFVRISYANFIKCPSVSVSHGSEVSFVYGAPPDTSAEALQLSSLMIDYWVSFATSLDPNDGKGLHRGFSFAVFVIFSRHLGCRSALGAVHTPK